jgi:hypothetical protein
MAAMHPNPRDPRIGSEFRDWPNPGGTQLKTMARPRPVIHRASDHTLELPDLRFDRDGDAILDLLEGSPLTFSHGDGVEDIIDLRYRDLLEPVSTIGCRADRTKAQNENTQQPERCRSFHLNLLPPTATREQ